MDTLLITGANRGLGLEFVRQYAGAGWRVFACCRDPAQADPLTALAGGAGGVAVHALDIDDHAAIAALADALRDETIDVLINNAGVMPLYQAFGHTDYARWAKTMWTNVFAPMRMAEAFAPHVARSRRGVLATLSSGLGSIANARGDGALAYRTSKAALNMVVRMMADALAPRGIIAVALTPGWVATDMGIASLNVRDEEGRVLKPDAKLADMLTPEVSIAGMRGVIDGLAAADAGRFIRYDGTDVPW